MRSFAPRAPLHSWPCIPCRYRLADGRNSLRLACSSRARRAAAAAPPAAQDTPLPPPPPPLQGPTGSDFGRAHPPFPTCRRGGEGGAARRVRHPRRGPLRSESRGSQGLTGGGGGPGGGGSRGPGGSGCARRPPPPPAPNRRPHRPGLRPATRPGRRAPGQIEGRGSDLDSTHALEKREARLCFERVERERPRSLIETRPSVHSHPVSITDILRLALQGLAHGWVFGCKSSRSPCRYMRPSPSPSPPLPFRDTHGRSVRSGLLCGAGGQWTREDTREGRLGEC